MGKVKEYSNGEVTIVWKPGLCIHSENCVKGLPSVFKAQAKPWIDPSGATTDAIIQKVKNCPSGALTTYLNAAGQSSEEVPDQATVTLKVVPDGPVLVKGAIHLIYPDGKEENKSKSVALCRCGASSKKPFCDGTHKQIDFKG
jgi:uncharacterized Fe-S cluster protein YjdI